MKKIEREFALIAEFIKERREGTVGFLNYAAVSTYWDVGAYVSSRLKTAAWGSNTVVALEDYLKTRFPKLKGYLGEFVQTLPAQIGGFQFVAPMGSDPMKSKAVIR